ncbi:MAG: metal ABC transporter permease, partial [Phycisphaerales bacterium]|nr:metal ABC transporter permease [Phycisphaerales bacterium]
MNEFLTINEMKNIATGVCVAVPIGVLGGFLVLRRMSLLGDAISHALLPGIIGAFLLSGTRDPLWMLAGALVIGLLTAGLSSCVKTYARVPEDASLGVVFSVLFALGVVMLSFVPRAMDFDPDCVLYGQLEYLALDSVSVMGVEMPRALLSIVPVGVVSLAFVVVCFPRLKLVTFDPALARALGINVALYSGVMLTLTAGTVVTGFQSVGSVLVVALLAAPGATAQLLTDRLSRMLALSAVFAGTAAIIGCVLAVKLYVSSAGMIAVVAGVQFALAVIFAPRKGLVSRSIARFRLSSRIARE